MILAPTVKNRGVEIQAPPEPARTQPDLDIQQLLLGEFAARLGYDTEIESAGTVAAGDARKASQRRG